MDSYGQCQECGANKPREEMIHVGIDDDGGRPIDLYKCRECAGLDAEQVED